jgi:putative oxidoreductase
VNIALWIVQVLLAAAFILAGVLKSVRPVESLAKQLSWVSAVPVAVVRFIGLAELLGGIGLLLPALTGVLPWLTPLAAIALTVVMLLAVGFHVVRREIAQIPSGLVLGLLAAFAAYGRLVLVPLGT